VLCSASAPLPAQAILPLARAYHEGLGLATVYRALHVLAERGLVRRVLREGACAYYLPAAPEGGDLVICTSCGRAQGYVRAEPLQALIRAVESQTGYVVAGQAVQLSGLCPVCAALAGAGEGRNGEESFASGGAGDRAGGAADPGHGGLRGDAGVGGRRRRPGRRSRCRLR